MSRLYRHLVWLSAPQDPITDDMLTIDDEIEEVSIYRAVGVPPHAEIKLTNPGWGIYAAGAARCAAIVESDDGTMATARVLARGTIRNLPDNLGKAAVTLTLECSGTTEETRLARNAAARAWEAAHPEPENEYTEGDAFAGDITAVAIPSQDLLLGRMERDADQVMVGRTLEWHCDPVSHAWSLHDFTVPMGTTRDIGETDPDKITRSAPKACPRRIKMRLVCNFTPQFSGACSIPSYLIPAVTSMTTWSYELVQRPGLSTGWTLDVPTVGRAVGVTGSIGVVEYDLSTRRVYEELVPGESPPRWVRINGSTGWSRHELMIEFEWYRYFFMSWTARWTYAQQRRETVDLVLDVPTQEVSGLVDEIELSDMTLGALYTIPRFLTDDRDADDETPEAAAPYNDETTYRLGDLVLDNGREYRLTIAESTGVFRIVANFTSSGFDVVVDPRWEETHRRPAFVTPTSSVFDQRRGLATIAAGFRIMRAKALEYLFEDFSLQVDRPDFPEWNLGDMCRTLIPGRHDEPQKLVEGRVVGIVERLRAEGGDVVELTLKVGKGLGGDTLARRGKINEFGGSDYFDDDYIDTVETDWLSAGDDIEWSIEADPLYLPVDPARLNDPLYSVLSILVSGSADAHEATMRALADSGTRIGTAMNTAAFPSTMVSVRMRAIPIERMITRRYRATGTLLRTPKGIQL